MQYYEKAALVNYWLNHDRSTCLTITGNEWMYVLDEVGVSINGIGSVTRRNICHWFVRKYKRAIQSGPYYNCTYQIEVAYRKAAILSLDLKERLAGVPLNLMNHAETAWRTEFLFNWDQDGCISYDPEAINTLFQRDMYLSGPLKENLCEKVYEYYGTDYTEMFSTCNLQTNYMTQPVSAKYNLYVIKSINPVYLIDYPSYVDSHSNMVYAFNAMEYKCKYNGFVTKT
ncbi:unnamed protein product [Dicrocoelium dendriticum]|nr:unnamed protein product [Dicrocoelium dendriticum]